MVVNPCADGYSHLVYIQKSQINGVEKYFKKRKKTTAYYKPIKIILKPKYKLHVDPVLH